MLSARLSSSINNVPCAKLRQSFTRCFHAAELVSPTAPAVESIRQRVHDKIGRIDSSRPFSPSLIDSYNRRHDYLRISLTEKCNLRCFYCMPSDGAELSPRENILSDDEVVRLATLFVRSGVKKIRLTGGEPTVRKGIVDLTARLNVLKELGLQSIGMTSNGLALHRRLPQLIQNGLTHLNLSLDTLDPLKFELITRRTGHDAVLRTLDAALSKSELHSVKLNVVVVKGLNDSEVIDFVGMTKDKKLSVRFIEFMPFTGNKWEKAKMISSSDLLARIAAQYPEISKIADTPNDTARSYYIPGHHGNFGFISSMSDHFCGSCNRLRITADGQIKVCLFDAKEVSLRDKMRSGASDAELLEVIGRAVGTKQEKHVGMEDIDVVKNRPMILIGARSLDTRRAFQPMHSFYSKYAALPSARNRLTVRLSSSHASSAQSLLTHVDSAGRPAMVDVSAKNSTRRTATACGRIYIPYIAYKLLASADDMAPSQMDPAIQKARSKGDVLTVAQLAAIMASKRTSDLIPLCHPLGLSHISVVLTPEEPEGPGGAHSVLCSATVTCDGRTGVEMEALTAVSVGLLTVWDMLKSVGGQEMMIGGIMVTQKEGGKNDFSRNHTESRI